jgi:hypothetical protein
MGKMQRVYKTGSDFWVEGASERGRWLRFVGRAKIGGREHLIFRPVKKAAKHRLKSS